ncbi:MAG TPA: ABC transporter ATP-binding protein [Ohtaekwangia sp.]|uniref:ABC transporter ATP-binding protein n=1 Tax=Ohtaekwangia sp. TaxID=2066019 RepID=UPI002F94CF77
MSQTSKKILLETNGLAVGHHGSDKALFENLNLSLCQGELVCFMGPNGIGKSTLIRTLAGLQKALKGTIRLGTNLHQQIAVVLTDKVVSSNMSVYELITFGRYPYLDWSIRLREEDKNIIDEAIRQVHIQPLIHKKLYQLSDGQLQLAMIARALTQTTPIILLDEPTAHLDLNNRVEIMRLLRDLARQTHRAILVATHELDLALQTADYIWLTGRSKNIITGIPEDLVLNGAFDDIFQFKGFDLKTGKVTQQAHRDKSIQLTGEGAEYLWTKNALERSGFVVTSSPADITIVIEGNTNALSWNGNGQQFNSLQGLLKYLGD